MRLPGRERFQAYKPASAADLRALYDEVRRLGKLTGGSGITVSSGPAGFTITSTPQESSTLGIVRMVSLGIAGANYFLAHFTEDDGETPDTTTGPFYVRLNPSPATGEIADCLPRPETGTFWHCVPAEWEIDGIVITYEALQTVAEAYPCYNETEEEE